MAWVSHGEPATLSRTGWNGWSDSRRFLYRTCNWNYAKHRQVIAFMTLSDRKKIPFNFRMRYSNGNINLKIVILYSTTLNNNIHYKLIGLLTPVMAPHPIW